MSLNSSFYKKLYQLESILSPNMLAHFLLLDDRETREGLLLAKEKRNDGIGLTRERNRFGRTNRKRQFRTVTDVPVITDKTVDEYFQFIKSV